ncbi:hypothetical protein B0H13DRAFT_2371776 [Mycena leptocephala]|nr:hypothetical protein B0H13DRAFT_2371776 [Mycena leptocephala]
MPPPRRPRAARRRNRVPRAASPAPRRIYGPPTPAVVPRPNLAMNTLGQNDFHSIRARIMALAVGPSPMPTPYARPLNASHARHRLTADDVYTPGSRAGRDYPLTKADLWLDGIGPKELVPNRTRDRCTLCHGVKSHPVS